jgi:outer membrane protein assembly factor BamB
MFPLGLAGIIPSLGVLGPLALLAALFPAVFGGLTLWLKRWSGLFAAACAMSTWYFLHRWLGGRRPTWWAGETGLWTALGLLALAGALAAARRYRRAVRGDNGESLQPRGGDRLILGLLTVAGAGLLAFATWGGRDLLRSPWLEVAAVGGAAAVGLAYLVAARRTRPAALSGETVVLWALAAACGGFVLLEVGRAGQGGFQVETTGAPKPAVVAWTFRPADPGTFGAAPVAADGRVYAAAAHKRGFHAFGTVYCLDAADGQELWRFDDGGDLKPVYSTPCLDGGRLYFGEGSHEDSGCKVYCLDAATGQKLWAFATTGHTESGPAVADGRVYIGAGDDGLYCLDAATGRPVWHFEGLHVDAPPAVAGGGVYAGSYAAADTKYQATEVFCLDAATGTAVWRVPVKLNVFGATVAGSRAYFGLGTGNATTSAAEPKGAVLCVDAATGRRRWQCDVPDGVPGRPVADRERVFFGCRDGGCYAVRRADGHVLWWADLGGPVVAAPAARMDQGICTALYAASSAGRVACLDPATGRPLWTFDVAREANAAEVQVLAAPVAADHAGRRRVYVAAGVGNLITWTPRLFALDEAEE